MLRTNRGMDPANTSGNSRESRSSQAGLLRVLGKGKARDLVQAPRRVHRVGAVCVVRMGRESAGEAQLAQGFRFPRSEVPVRVGQYRHRSLEMRANASP